jgi:hypothetical protein
MNPIFVNQKLDWNVPIEGEVITNPQPKVLKQMWTHFFY